MLEQDVTQDPSPAVSEDVSTQEPKVPDNGTQEPTVTPAPGSHTPPENLLAALKEERALRKEAEERARIAEEAVLSQVPISPTPDGQDGELSNDIKELKSQVTALQESRDLERLQVQYPALKDKTAEFNEYRKDYPRHKLENVAKLFLTELGAIGPTRDGLERPAGAGKAPVQTGTMSVEDAQKLRTTDFKKYIKLLQEGKIVIT